MKRKIAVLFCCLLVFAGVGIAQNVTATIAGTVTDNSGAVVPNAKVTVTNTDQSAVIKTVDTDASGNFAATYLPLGHYSVSIEAPNFQTYTEKGIELHVSDRYTLNAKLQVGATEQKVTVEAGAIQVETQSATAAGLISGTQVRELALNGRNWEQLVTLSPGVSDASDADQIYVGSFAPQGTNLVRFSISGGRREQNNFMIDGADNIDRGSNLTLLSFPSVDAIQEFKVIRGQYDPEYGRASSGQVNLVTRSGTSTLHGTIYEFLRNDALNANSYFNKHFATPVRKPILRYNNFGGTIGGPVYIPKIYEQTNKTFFFFSEEARRNIVYSNPTAEIPTAGMRTGQFLHPVCVSFDTANKCTGTASLIAQSSFDPIAQAYLKDIFSKYPQPNATTASDPFGFTSTLRGIFNFREEIYKIDHIFNQKFSISGKILRDSIPTEEPAALFNNGPPIQGVGTTSTNSPGHNYTFRGTITMSPTLLIEPGYSYSYGAILSDPIGLMATKNSPDVASAVKLPFTSALARNPNLTFAGATPTVGASGPGSFGPYRDYNRNHTAFGNVTKVSGAHTIKAGATYYHYNKSENAGGNNAGTFAFNNNGVPTGTGSFEQAWANFLLGRVGTFSQSSLDLVADIKDNQFEYYAQDTWRVKPNLTLSYGLRHSLFRQPTDSKGFLGQFDPAFYDSAKAPCVIGSGSQAGNLDLSLNSSGQVVSACNPNFNPLNGYIFAHPPAGGTRSPFGDKVGKEYNWGIAPRIGLAWDPWNNGKTSIRTGFGMFYDNGIIFGNAENDIFLGSGFLTNLSITNTTTTNPTGGTRSFSSAATELQSRLPINYRYPFTSQWSLDLQRDLHQGWILDIGYYGNVGRHLPGFNDINQPAENAYRKCTDATPCKSGANNISFGAVPVVNTSNFNLLNALRPFVGYSGGRGVLNIYTSNYNGLQTQLQKQFSGSSLINFAYTWSHTLTTYQADRSIGRIMPLQGHIRDNNYSPGIGDRRHVFTGNFVWDLPWLRNQPGPVGHILGGWEISGIQTFQTGLPETVSSDQLIDPTGADCLGPSPCLFRANQIGDPNSNAAHNFDTGWFNAAAFANPVAGQTTIPSEKPGAVRLPGFWRTDMGFFKNLKFTERFGGQFRAEAFNIFNHTNPICCASFSTSSANYDKVRSTRDPRTMQFGLKLNF